MDGILYSPGSIARHAFAIMASLVTSGFFDFFFFISDVVCTLSAPSYLTTFREQKICSFHELYFVCKRNLVKCLFNLSNYENSMAQSFGWIVALFVGRSSIFDGNDCSASQITRVSGIR